jgi:hypothetical protein
MEIREDLQIIINIMQELNFFIKYQTFFIVNNLYKN